MRYQNSGRYSGFCEIRYASPEFKALDRAKGVDLQISDNRTIETTPEYLGKGEIIAGRSGQLLNLSGLASDCGISHTTARRWISVLEASFVITLLRPYHQNYGKRLIKSPKIYFLNTRLLCYLLQVRSPSELNHRAERGAIFGIFVVSDLLKNFVRRGEQSSLYLWRDSAGHEIDVIIDLGSQQIALEIKSAQTVASDFFNARTYWRDLSGDPDAPAALIYGGDRAFIRSAITVYAWYYL